jgi:hypothetical protein
MAQNIQMMHLSNESWEVMNLENLKTAYIGLTNNLTRKEKGTAPKKKEDYILRIRHLLSGTTPKPPACVTHLTDVELPN